MRFSVLGSILALALPLAAQEEGDAAAQERTQALLATLTDVDERLLGTTRFTVYVKDTVKLGEMTLAVERHADAAKGAYGIKLEATIVAGENRFENVEELVLGADLGARSGKRHKSERSGATGKQETQVLTPVVGGWELARQRDENPEQKALVALDGPNHCSLGSLLLLARKLDPTQAATYLVRATRWKEGQEGPVVYRARLSLQPAARKVKRGDAEVEVAAVKVLREGESDMTFLLDAERRLVELTDDSSGIRFVVGDAPPPQPAGGAGEPTSAVVTYLRVLAKAEPVEALNGVMDWQAIHAGMGAEDENIRTALTADQLAEILRQQFAEAEAGITPDQVETLRPLLELKLEGDAAEVLMPGAPAPFKLRKTELGWKITYFPH